MHLSLRFGLLACTAMACLAADDATASAAPASKSIVDAKYRVKKEPDWVAELIARHATKFKTVTKQVAVEGSDEKATTEEKRADGVDVDGLFRLAALNNIDVAKFQAQREGHGFAGRFRMTVSNMLRGAARARHGLFEPGAGEEPVWTSAPAEWLTAKGAGEQPTHNPDGTKIVRAKPAADAPAEGAEAAEGEAEQTEG